MDITTDYGRTRTKRVSIDIHLGKSEVKKIKHFPTGEDSGEFYTQGIEFENEKGEFVIITLFSDEIDSLLDPKKEVIEVERKEIWEIIGNI